MKTSCLFVAALCAALTLGGCRTNVEPRFADLSVDTVVLCGAVPCDLSCRFRTIENADRSEALSAVENANINYFFAMEDFVGAAKEAVPVFIDRFVSDYACDTLYNPAKRYTLNVTSDAARLDTLIVYTVRRESYTGGAHGMRSTRYHNYGIAGGCEVTLDDLFSEEELARLTGQIKAKLCDQYDSANEEELARLGFFPSMIVPTENFEITSTGITFHYDPYEIASYAMGEIEVPFARAELSLK